MENMVKDNENVAELKKKIDELQALVNFYQEQFKLSQKQKFGKSSEKSPDQLYFKNFFNEAEEQADEKLPEPTFEQITYKRQKRMGKKKDDLSKLPVERVDYELSDEERTCPKHGTLMRDMGVTIRDELEIIPAKVIHKEHAVHAYCCDKCDKENDKATIVRAEAPKPMISGSAASASLVSYIAVQKYLNGIPLYRLEKSFAYEELELSRQTMANWLIYCAQNYLSGIYSLLIKYLLQEREAHADETTFQVLKEPGRCAQQSSYEWLYRTSRYAKHKIAVYDYQQTRSQIHPLNFLKNFIGYLHCDGYQVYHNLPPGIIVVGCWAHARRKWNDLYETIAKDKRSGSLAERGLVYINLLFLYEYEFYDLEPEERYEKRLRYSKPVSDEFFEWVASVKAVPKTLLGKATNYALSQREYLENIYLDGRLEISNNRAERSIKPFVQGRKQWLFANTPNGAESSSILYSIIETAKENRLNPFNYLKYLLETIPNITSNALEDLLPWSDILPENCHVYSVEEERRPKKFNENDPLFKAVLMLREKFRLKDLEKSS